MGGAKRARPERLGEKLRIIREHFDCSLAGMAERLSKDNLTVNRTDISRYELSQREPPLPLILAYSKLANVYVEVLIDDSIDLPDKIPSIKKIPV